MNIVRLPFIVLHSSLALIIVSAPSYALIVLCLFSTYIRLFGITAGFHRYFSHKSFKTSKWFQCFLGMLGTSAAQHGPLWWAAHHRHHHRFSDTERDIHSPKKCGFFVAHMGWLFNRKHIAIQEQYVTDLLQHKELRLMERYYYLIVAGYALCVTGIGYVCHTVWPTLGITAFDGFVWGFCVSTVLLYHLTFSINSLMHTIGHRVYNTTDNSRNSAILALLTLGEGWHNNHHRYPHAERQGFVWWQIDITHSVLSMLNALGIIWDLKPVPKYILEEGGYLS